MEVWCGSTLEWLGYVGETFLVTGFLVGLYWTIEGSGWNARDTGRKWELNLRTGFLNGTDRLK